MSERQRHKNGRKPNCIKCGNLIEESRPGKQAHCKACHAEEMRNNRASQKELFQKALAFYNQHHPQV